MTKNNYILTENKQNVIKHFELFDEIDHGWKAATIAN